MTTGPLNGKFMPPHAGPNLLIDAARAQVEALSLVVFAKAAEPIPGPLRVRWLREHYPT